MEKTAGPVEVAAFRGLDEAEVARGVLESEGIETHLSNEHAQGGPSGDRARRKAGRVILVSGCAIAGYGALYMKMFRG